MNVNSGLSRVRELTRAIEDDRNADIRSQLALELASEVSALDSALSRPGSAVPDAWQRVIVPPTHAQVS